jgi:hypothetical protein
VTIINPVLPKVSVSSDPNAVIFRDVLQVDGDLVLIGAAVVSVTASLAGTGLTRVPSGSTLEVSL